MDKPIDDSMSSERQEDSSEVEGLASPVGSGAYVVRDGDCMSSIASATGHFWETLWNLRENTELRNARQDPNVLLPGDRVFIPQLREKQETCASGRVHRFRRRGVPERLRFRILRYGEPRRKEPFVLLIRTEGSDQTIEGTTDNDGLLDVFVPPGATEATLVFWDETIELKIGHLNPANSVQGVAARLRNLGFLLEAEPTDASVEEAIRAFQRSRRLRATGKLGALTTAALEAAYLSGKVD
jgi:N-acetylmuramoyl-L-alanine amidase